MAALDGAFEAVDGWGVVVITILTAGGVAVGVVVDYAGEGAVQCYFVSETS